ncbi:DNA recombination and repair protein RecF [hydrothermal vent metagenome]|uniref:DNA recombination and repair protein RecF n=1 Tax=hydrothermal vent metagenome TaxID=652676 RepID=A0A3B0XCF9_9ZZZZ
MGLSSLEINHFRNLQSVKIKPDADLNLIIGKNAAGKTSLLEAIFYLSYGRSFRSSQIKHLIAYDEASFRLICNLDDTTTRIGLQRDFKEQTIRVNREPISRISELSTLLPVLVLHPDSHQLITAGPENRRQFMDWGVFHVEHHFIVSWKKYKKALSQRNAALRLQQPDKLCSLWNKELIEHALLIEKYRRTYLNEISEKVEQLSKELFPDILISLTYKRGWPDDIDFEDYLNQSLFKDRDKGFTQSGPHRADIKITVNGKSAQSSISRGQQKKLVSLLKIAQLSFFSKLSERRCILLYDDLPAELDESNQNKILSILSKLNIQLFVTAIERHQINYKNWKSHKVFHVEHGNITEIE